MVEPSLTKGLVRYLGKWLGFRTRNDQHKENQTLEGRRNCFLYCVRVSFPVTNFANRLSEVQGSRPTRAPKSCTLLIWVERKSRQCWGNGRRTCPSQEHPNRRLDLSTNPGWIPEPALGLEPLEASCLPSKAAAPAPKRPVALWLSQGSRNNIS